VFSQLNRSLLRQDIFLAPVRFVALALASALARVSGCGSWGVSLRGMAQGLSDVQWLSCSGSITVSDTSSGSAGDEHDEHQPNDSDLWEVLAW
jgi:hypothetical protein